MPNILIGLTGLPASGKGEFVRIVEDFCLRNGLRFIHRSLSDVLRNRARSQGLAVERQVLHELGNALRKERGGGVLAEIVSEELAPQILDDNVIVVIDAIRTPEEIATLREHYANKFYMVAMKASPELLTRRIADRARDDELPGAVKSEAVATQLLSVELGSGEPRFGLNIQGAIDCSDEIIDNNSSIDGLRARVEQLLTALQKTSMS